LTSITADFVSEQLSICDELLLRRGQLVRPRDLPGRYGRAIQAIDHVLNAMCCEAVLAGGWAVWYHGFLGRMTQDIDIVLPALRIEEFQKVCSVSGFEMLAQNPGRWPKVRHKETDIKVDILPEGGRPGTAARPAPTTIPSPASLGASAGALEYIRFSSLIELKVAAGRARDEADIVELVRAHPERVEEVQKHLASVHPDYVAAFNHLLERAREQQDE